jgi:hypothetical protein
MPSPARPTQLSPYAEVVLQALAGAGLGHKISLGGALGLQHYCEYRVTSDIDAWWEPSATGEERELVLRVVEDLVASKMVALVERGAPRDFRDIYALCQEGRVTGRECWRLWRERQQRAGSDLDPYRARLAIETHLSRIAQHRPLGTIAEPGQRAAAASLRNWFAQEFLDALVD